MGILKSGKCKSKARLDGKTAVITGSDTGIGYETARGLVKRGCRVILACCHPQKAAAAAEKLASEVSGSQVRVVHLDLASLNSVKQCAELLKRTEDNIHLLINNAGIMLCPFELSEDGCEMQFQVNHLGHFLLTKLLLIKIEKSAPSRIINISSIAHVIGKIHFNDLHSTKKYSKIGAYCQSKLCNLLFTLELQEKLKGTGVVAYAVHPGAVNTNIFSILPSCVYWTASNSRLFKTPKQGAQTSLHCAVDEKLVKQCGLYFSDCKEMIPSRKARNKENASKLWQISEELVKSFL